MQYTARQLEKLIKKAGWVRVDQCGSHRHYEHPTIPGKITIPFHKPDKLKLSTARSILQAAGLIEKEGK